MILKEVRHLITYDCNLRCKHCYLQAWERNLNAEVPDFTQETLDEFYWFYKPETTSATWWEPLLRPEFVYRLAKATANYWWKIELVTNWFFLNEDVFEKIMNINPGTFFQISLDGTEKEHNTMRWNDIAYKKALEAINLTSSRGARTKVRFTATNDNINTLDNLVKVLESYNRDNIELIIRPVLLEWRAATNNLWKLDEDWLQKLRNLSWNIIIETTDNAWRCWCWIDTIAINPLWDIYPCTYFTEKLWYKMWNITDKVWKLEEHLEFKKFNWTCYARKLREISL